MTGDFRIETRRVAVAGTAPPDREVELQRVIIFAGRKLTMPGVLKALVRVAGFLVLSAALTACASNDIRWTEEVKLSDGRVIEIQRRVELTGSGFPVQRRGFRKYVEICYPPMKLRWKSSGAYVPDIFDIVGGKAYMHVPLSGCYECGLHGDPDPNALYFVWDKGRWKRIRHKEFPKASEWNLLMGFVSARGYENEDPRGRLTLADKEQRPSSLRYEQKKLGWKRVNESYGSREGCKKCGRNQSNASFADAQEIFISDGKTSCEP